MKRLPRIGTTVLLIFCSLSLVPQFGPSAVAPAYLGFDRNDYPGDENLKLLRQTFSYAGFWLNRPPGEKTNSWTGKRQTVQAAGFGFLVLFNGRRFAQLKTVSNAGRLGQSDGQIAVASARREGFPEGAVIFLDQEEGGRMLPAQKAYIYAWVDTVAAAGFRAGIYCSGIAAEEDGGVSVITAQDVRQNSAGRKIAYWVANDACPPSPGCTLPKPPPSPAESGIDFAEVWQFAQSPRRRDVAGGCPANYNRDGSCYPPGVDLHQHLYLDLNTAASADPSHGRTR
ncbi:MAG: glycoside hydrolase domain-containing protein [Terriglobales bacterium]